MNFINNINIKSNLKYGWPMLIKHIKKGKLNTSVAVENVQNRYNENVQTLIKVSDMVNDNNNKNQLKISNKNELNLKISNLKNELSKSILVKSDSILMNEQQFIGFISPFNNKLVSFSNHIYTFTNKSYKEINKNLNNLFVICNSAFLNMSSFISKPIVSINPNLIKITLFYYWKPLKANYYNSNSYSKFLILYYNKLEKLVTLLNELFKKSVELELIRIYSPQNESNILANLIGILSNFIKFRYIHMKLFKVSKTKNLNKGFSSRFRNNKLPSFLSGIYLKLAGRVLTQRLQRRVKSKIVQRGSLARTSANLTNINRFVNKNKRGAFSITIKTGHIIND